MSKDEPHPADKILGDDRMAPGRRWLEKAWDALTLNAPSAASPGASGRRLDEPR